MAQFDKLIPKIRYQIKTVHRNIPNPEGPKGRIDKIRKVLTALFKYERLELTHSRADEVRGYAERLIAEAARHGDCHQPTMELADFWLQEKQLIHKLFKVLVPRYKTSESSFTALHYIPMNYASTVAGKRDVRLVNQCVLELKGNPYPPMPGKAPSNIHSLTNILLIEAKKEYKREKAAKEKLSQSAPEIDPVLLDELDGDSTPLSNSTEVSDVHKKDGQ